MREKMVLLGVSVLWASCSREPESATVPPEQAKVSVEPRASPEQPPPAAEPTPGAQPDPRAVGWDKLRFEDEVPLCVFADHAQRDAAAFLKDVRKQTLKADARVVFGAFPPGCIAEACDAVPTLECWVDPGEAPNTLIVHTRFRYEHKQGSTCSTDCSSIIAGCESPELKAGRYSVKYGARTFPLRIPSVVREPCFDTPP